RFVNISNGHVEWSLYVKEEGHAGRTGRQRSGHGGEHHWKSGWQNRLRRERYKSEERPKEGHKTRKEAENGITKKGQERGKESRAAQDVDGDRSVLGEWERSRSSRSNGQCHTLSFNT